MKRFDGWEPSTVTDYEYDDAGRLVRSVAEREPEWDEPERAWVLALADYRAQVHEACGTFLPDATRLEDDGAFRAELPVRCHVCTARAQAMTAHMKGNSSPHPEALLWPVVRKG